MKAALLTVLAAVAFAQPDADRIDALPGFDGTLTPQWSGYLNGNEQLGEHLHYWFVESEGNPHSDPVVLWLNGGPGCSSLDGFLYEQGPLHFGPGENNLTLQVNPWRWNRVANMLFLEAPAGVGFSYATDSSAYITNDNKTADANHNALKDFFSKFPKYQSNDFYITGESYGGIYVPTLAYRVMQDSSINFKGIAVGNGVTSWEYMSGPKSFWPMLHGHAIIPTSVYEDLLDYCEKNKNTEKCNAAQDIVQNNMKNVDIYDLYSPCFHQRNNMKLHPDVERVLPKEGGGLVPPCTDATKATRWLNQQDVKSAIHVQSDITWAICTTSINYTDNTRSVIPIYRDLMAGGYRVLVYSGDVDASVPFTGTQGWIDSLSLPAKTLWEPWFFPTGTYLKQQVGGFVSQYTSGAHGLEYVTVRGAGHMVPQFKPQPAYYMISRYLAGQSVLDRSHDEL